MRAWIAFIITVSFALQGWAATRALDEPCPMEAEMSMAIAQAVAGGEDAAALLGDCCNDMATFSLTGQACKSGQDGQAPLAAIPLPLATKAAAAVRQTVSALDKPTVFSAIPVAVWRPPNFL